MYIDNKFELDNEMRMLTGNINRMCMSTNRNEMSTMFNFAIRRVTAIYDYNMTRIYNEEMSHETPKTD